jgi:nucleotide-binding universal stress UspA family protein/hemerythrin-like domain-containing protein
VYRHLLVPIDGTDLSVEVVGNAVALARPLGARITFFHASENHAASLRGEADAVRLTSRENYDYAFTGRPRELLAKAEAAARAFGVPCASMQAVHDKPAQAIVGAAREAGCDLIFMASHGGRGRLGMAYSSETFDVLMKAGLPVLVSATGEPSTAARAIGILRDEHRSLAAVLHAWMHALARAREEDRPVDLTLMRAIVHYVRVFPVALHHPKEEQQLFRRLRARTPVVNAELDELDRQHARDRQLVDEIAALVDALDGAGPATRASMTHTLEEAVGRYATFQWEHMGREEGVVLPAAQRYLDADDWAAIDAAFAANADPHFGNEDDGDFRHLFSRIVNLANE